MKIKDKTSFSALIVTLVLIVVPVLLPKHPAQPLFDGEPINGIIDLGAFADTSRALVTGYNYHLLEKYASSHNLKINISLAERYGSGLDSLRKGAADIVVMPCADTIKADSILVSIPVDSMANWLMSHDCKERMKDLNRWIEAYHNSDGYGLTREKFLHTYSPMRSGRRDCLSPYDSLIRIHADTLGWDWRMLAAVVWQESRFHIEARSRRGASGLMQMMPQTAQRFDVYDTLDPNLNIMAGARYLGFLQKKFYHYGDNRTERYKYVLAAYNAGEGRIQDCIRYALYCNVDISYWQNIVNIIPKMNEPAENELELLRFGAFKGRETIKYVENVISVYNEFCRIYPESD